MPEQKRILAVYAHPDDAEIWAGGTLLAHRARGDQVAICVASHGNGPRAVEARRGAALLGAELHHLSCPDRGLARAPELVAGVVNVLRRVRPHIILTHWALDSHPDHRAVWHAVSEAIMLGEVETDIQALLWSDTYNMAGLYGPFVPAVYVNVSQVWDAKIAAIMAHESQNPAMYRDMTQRQCAMHGAVCGVPAAEGFIRAPLLGIAHRALASLSEIV